jgi:hypothetical protein
MTDKPKILGYSTPTEENIAQVNINKVMEERLLQRLDELFDYSKTGESESIHYDARWLAVAKTHFEQGFMAMNRAIMQPNRFKL